jgi:hypothetical protein
MPELPRFIGESNSPRTTSQEMKLEVQLNVDSPLSLDDKLDSAHVPRITRSRVREGLARNQSLESILKLLKDKPLYRVNIGTYVVCLKANHNPEKQGKKVFVNVGVDFNNKRAGHLLSRMVRNMFKQRENPTGTIIIEDHDSSCEDTNGKSEEEDHNQYDFFL